MIVKVGPFCRKGLSPQGEPPWDAHPLHVAACPFIPPRLVAGRGKPRSPPRQGGPTEIRDYSTQVPSWQVGCCEGTYRDVD